MALNRSLGNIDASAIELPEYPTSDAPPDTLFFNSSEGIVYKDASGNIHGSGSGGGDVGGYASQTADGSTVEFRINTGTTTDPAGISVEPATKPASTDFYVGYDSATDEITVTYAAPPASGEDVGWYWTITGDGDGGGSDGGGGDVTTTSTTTDYTASEQDRVAADASTGDVQVMLPPPSVNVHVTVKKTDATSNDVIIATPDAQMIDGHSELPITNQYTSRSIMSDGVDFLIF